MGSNIDIKDTEIVVVFKDKEGDPMCRMREPGRLPAPHDAEIHKELMPKGRLVNAVIEVRSANPGVVVVHLSQDKTVIDTRETKDGDLSLWARKCPVTLVDFRGKRVATTKYPDNNVRVLEMTEDARLRVHVVSVSAQNGLLFFNRQVIIDQPCFQKDGKVVFPANPDITDRWKVEDLLDEVYADWVKDLPDASKMHDLQPAPAPADADEGVVLWYSLAMGLGAIRTKKGDARIHWSNLPERESGFRYLATGERVRFDELDKIEQKADQRKTQFRFEAKGIKLIAA